MEERADRVRLLGTGEELGGVALGAVLGEVAEDALRRRIVPQAARIVRDAVGDEKMQLRRLDAAMDQLGDIAMALPGGEVAHLVGPGAAGADAQTGDGEPVLVGIEMSERLAEGLAQTVARVGAGLCRVVDALAAAVEADRMVGR